MGTLGCFAFFALIPESPRWLLLNNRREEAIKNFNFIAWFNGSDMRVPEDAIFDIVGQVIEENQTLNKTKNGKINLQINQTIN
jgi:hypothetical protein